MTTHDPWVYVLLFLAAYMLIARFTLFFGLKLYGATMEAKTIDEQDAAQRLAILWPIVLPVLCVNLLIAIFRTIQYWPDAPGKGPS